MAHLLINRFGSLEKVFDASFEELLTVPGIKEHSATLIKMIPSLARIYYMEKNKPGNVLADVDAWGKYFVNRYIGIEVETVFLLLLDNKFNIIECIKVHEGSVNSSAINPRKLLELAYSHKAPMAVIAHNHPSGLAIPSSADLMTTYELARSFQLLNVKLLAHIVVAGDQYTDILMRKNEISSMGISSNNKNP